jgi:hypothetical protein
MQHPAAQDLSSFFNPSSHLFQLQAPSHSRWPLQWLLALAGVWAAAWPAVCVQAAEPARLQSLGLAQATPAGRQLIDWVKASGDNQRLPFIVIDKKQAQAFAFDAAGQLRGASPVLMGAARGDHSVPGIGERPMASILPHERTTPAGRFVAEIGHNAKGEDILWVDYEAAVSLHRVRPQVAAERRLERLASASPRDNRISYGCINVPQAFYEQVVRPLVDAAQGRAVVYVMPEVLPLSAVFPSLGQALKTAAWRAG